MSLITSCPACGTMFRVVPDQLKISEGWVRCGHCTEVFDATAHLAEQAPVEDFTEEGVTQPGEMNTVPGGWVPHAPPPPPPRPAPREPLVIPTSTPAPTSAPPVAAAARQGTDSELEPSALDVPFVFRRSDLVDTDPMSSVSPPAPSRFDVEAGEDDALADADLEDVSFVRQARRKAYWRRPGVRILLSLVGLLLGATLLLQAAWHDRDRLALAQPGLKPALEQMCELLQCKLGAPRQIEALVIESSGFNRLRSDTYRLSFSLRNSAATAVALPLMELTLTDTQDQPVARRVLTPAELGAPDPVIAASGDWSANVGLAVSLNGGARIAGYRLLAFYP
jgi:predicted Zn finger-like uncharacterized protein